MITPWSFLFPLLDHWFIIKGSGSRTARWRDVQGKVWGKGAELPYPLQASDVPWISPHVHQLSSSPLDFSEKYLKYWKNTFVSLLMETQISFISPLVYSIPKEKCRSLNSMMKMLHFSKSLIQGQNNIVSWGPSRDLSEDPMK